MLTVTKTSSASQLSCHIEIGSVNGGHLAKEPPGDSVFDIVSKYFLHIY